MKGSWTTVDMPRSHLCIKTPNSAELAGPVNGTGSNSKNATFWSLGFEPPSWQPQSGLKDHLPTFPPTIVANMHHNCYLFPSTLHQPTVSR